MPKVLVVDDTAVDRIRAGGLLTESGRIQVSYAEHGLAALDAMAREVPDVVVTDLQMPQLDGLELVTRIRTNYPQVPVVLMTALGSDQFAIEALERGAAHYVPKAQLSERLLQTVDDVLLVASSHRTYEALARCQVRAEFEYVLENDAAILDPLAEMLQSVVSSMDLTDPTGVYRVGLALREAMHNALYHGNLQLTPEDVERSREDLLGGGQDLVSIRREQFPYRDRRIRVHATVSREEARFVIRDDGPGFDYASMLMSLNPRATGTLASGQSRGFVLILSFMDEVSFNDSGNEITMVKVKDTPHR